MFLLEQYTIQRGDRISSREGFVRALKMGFTISDLQELGISADIVRGESVEQKRLGEIIIARHYPRC